MYTAVGGPQYEEYLEARKSGEIIPDRSACAHRLLEKTVEHESELIKEMQGKIANLEELVADIDRNDGNIGSSVGEHLSTPVSKEDKGDEGGSHFSLDDLLLDAQAAYEYQNFRDDSLPVIHDDELDR